MKIKYCLTILLLLLLLLVSCANPNEFPSTARSQEILETSVSEESITTEEVSSEEVTNEENVLVNPNTLSDERKAEIRERYANPPYGENPYFQYNVEYTPKYTTEEILSALSIGMTQDEAIELIGLPKPYITEQGHSAVNVWAYRTNPYYSLEGDLLGFITSYAGTGTEEDPFRSVITEIWLEQEMLESCDSIAEEMALGILPTFLAVELHGTEYLISEGLLSEEEAVFYAEEQAVYLASQAEQESLPDAEIPETAPEVVVE